MLAKYARRVARLPGAAQAAVREELELSPRQRALVPAVTKSGMGTADVVLALLRRGMVSEAEGVAGVPVRSLLQPARVAGGTVRVVIPGAEPPPAPVATAAEVWEDERLVWLQPDNPRPYNSDAAGRYAAARVGMTRAQLVRLGVDRREMREWERRGWADFL